MPEDNLGITLLRVTDKERNEGIDILGVKGRGYIKYIVHSECIEMHAIFISEEYRRQGLGSKIWLEMQEKAREYGHKEFMVFSSTTSPDIFHNFLVSKGCSRADSKQWNCPA
jgi:N-acetylglutamate synthase-like GNAT family acetyltransferase